MTQVSTRKKTNNGKLKLDLFFQSAVYLFVHPLLYTIIFFLVTRKLRGIKKAIYYRYVNKREFRLIYALQRNHGFVSQTKTKTKERRYKDLKIETWFTTEGDSFWFRQVGYDGLVQKTGNKKAPMIKLILIGFSIQLHKTGIPKFDLPLLNIYKTLNLTATYLSTAQRAFLHLQTHSRHYLYISVSYNAAHAIAADFCEGEKLKLENTNEDTTWHKETWCKSFWFFSYV